MTEPGETDDSGGGPCPPPDLDALRNQREPRVAPDQLGRNGTWAMPAGSGPCRTWPLEPGCGCMAPGQTHEAWGGAATWTPEQTRAVELATEMLWRATAGRFGLCQEIIRPCVRCCCDTCDGGSPRPELHGGQWINMLCGGCNATMESCGCAQISTIRLPGPVYWEPLIAQPDWNSPWRPIPKPPDLNANGPRYRLIVWIDGNVLFEPGWPEEWQPGDTEVPPGYTPSPGDYWLVGNMLQRMGGKSWPLVQNLQAGIQPSEAHPQSAEGSFAVQYWRGQPVPPGGRRAMSVLACELWKACTDTPGCRLPQHVQSVTRQGVQYDMLDTTDYASQGRIGLPEVDSWLGMVNPHGQRSPSGVWSPDMPKHHAHWTTGGRSGA